MADDDYDLLPPSPVRVAQRTLVLAAVVCRGFLENNAADEWAAVVWDKLLPWLEQHKLICEVEPTELDLIGKPLGTLDRHNRIDATWRSEGLVVLAWALRAAELPSYDEQVASPSDLAEAIGFLEGEATTVFLKQSSLRTQDEIDDLAELLLACHWRLRQFQLHPEHIDFMKLGQQWEWLGTRGVAQLSLIEGDLVVSGLPIAKASATAISTCTSIVQERHQAVNWIRGCDAIYSRVTTDT